jgi:transporter family protein
MRQILQSWPFWALASAVFAALTAILAKVGVAGVDSSFATLVRTAVVLVLAAAVVAVGGSWPDSSGVSARSYLFLVLSGIATGLSWLCYFRALKLGDAARVAPVDKLSVVLVTLFAVLILGERLSVIGWTGVVLITAGAILVGFGA